jgi:hypothetical protein
VTNIVNIPATGSNPACPVNRPPQRPVIVHETNLGFGQLLGMAGNLARVRFSSSNTVTLCDPRVLKLRPDVALRVLPGGAIRVSVTPHRREPAPVLPSSNKARFQHHNADWTHGMDINGSDDRDDRDFDATGAVGRANDVPNDEGAALPGRSSLWPIDPTLVKNTSKHHLGRMSRKQRKAYKLSQLYSQGIALHEIAKELAVTRKELAELRTYVQRVPGALQRPPKEQPRDEYNRFTAAVLVAD